MLAIPLSLAVVLAGSLNQDADIADMPPRDAAIAVAQWLDSVQVETEHGIAWPVAPADSPDVARNLYSGTPGVILFFIELHRATGDDQYIEKATRGGDDLLSAIPETGDNLQVGLYTGIAGPGFVLNELFEATKEVRFRDGANRCVDLLVSHSMQEDRDGEPWGGVTDIIGGAAGAGCFLLYAANKMNRDDALGAAIKAGDWLLSEARPVELEGGDQGLEWAMSDDFPRMMPNFSHGTAGVAYFLASLQDSMASDGETDNRFFSAALRGTQTLHHISGFDPDHERVQFVYHHSPDGEDLFYLGWCHGPPGTVRLFERLERLESGGQHGTTMTPLSRGLVESGIPDRRTPGFWNNVGQCCGSAGIASFSLSVYETSAHRDFYHFAMTMHRDLMQRATVGGTEDEPMLSWTHAEHRVQPDFLQAQTGYMQGAAGIGLWLLQLDAHQSDRGWTLQFPDSPW